MVKLLLKSLLLYSALATSAVLAAPAHQHESDFLARDVSPRDGLTSPHLLADGLIAPIPAAIGKRSKGQGGGVKKITNAMRMANGLPPLAPRRLYDGSRAGSALTARSSPVPPVSIPVILVYGPDGRSGSPLGYVSQGLNQNAPLYYMTTDCNQAMTNAKLFEGDLINPAQPQGYPNVGVFPNDNVSSFTAGSPMIGYMVGTAAAPNGPAVLNPSHSLQPGTSRYTESKVWSLGPNDELLVTWTNSNGATMPLEITSLINANNYMAVTASLSSARSSAGVSFPKLRLFMGNMPSCGS